MFDPNALPHPHARQPIFKVPPATLYLSLLLIVIFLVLRVLPDPELDWVLGTFGFQPLRFLAALDGRAELLPAAWPLVTHTLLHYDGLHLVTNVGFLLAFASPVERRIGAWRLLALFFVCGIAGGLVQTWLVFDPAERAALLIGASGGIFGLMAVALTLPGLTGGSFRLAPAILILMVLNVAIGLASEFGLMGDYLIGWQAHAGGFLVGLLIGWLMRRGKPGGPARGRVERPPARR